MDRIKIMQEAAASEISPYLVTKRKMYYRKLRKSDQGKNCLNCSRCVDSPLKGCAGKSHCLTIGINLDYHAFVDKEHICRGWYEIK